MQIYVINLLRRPDRRTSMQEQADALGLSVRFVEAVDARQFHATPIDVEVKQGLTRRRIADGDLACTLSHRKVWRMLVESGESHAVVLEDDIILSNEATPFLASDEWIPPQVQLVKLERYGRRGKLHAVDRSPVSIHSRSLLRFYTKHVGAAGYIISAEAARLLLEETQTIGEPVDQVMFNPSRSAVFHQLRPYMLDPAICEQSRDTWQSDIHLTRRQPDTRPLAAIGVELRSIGRQLLAYLPLLGPMLYRQVRLRSLEFR